MASRQLTLLPEQAPAACSSPHRSRVSPAASAVRVSPEMELGRAGEYLVLADLLLNGWVAYPTSQGVPYDVAVDIGERIIRVQVKSTLMPKSGASMKRSSPLYMFHTRRAGKGGRRPYGKVDFDVLALVALDRRLIAYYPMRDCHQDSIAVRVPGIGYGIGGVKSRQFAEAGFECALAAILNAPRYCGD